MMLLLESFRFQDPEDDNENEIFPILSSNNNKLNVFVVQRLV